MLGFEVPRLVKPGSLSITGGTSSAVLRFNDLQQKSQLREQSQLLQLKKAYA